MPDSKSSTRIFFRLSNELAEALDTVLPELRQETLGEVGNRSKAARYLLIEALHERQRRTERRSLIDEALKALDEEPVEVADGSSVRGSATTPDSASP